MASSEDIVITAKLKDNVSSNVDKIQSKFTHMSSEAKATISNAMNTASAAIVSFSKDAVQSAMTAEAEWTRFGAAVDSTGGNWEQQSTEVKKWVRDFSDSMGRATSDTRAAMTTYMNYGMSLEQSQSAMKATAGVAAAMGTTEEEASSAVIQALNGRGMALKKLGINMDDYKDSVTGTIDKEKLLTDLQARFGGNAEKYANTATAKFQRLQNTINSVKTEFGAAFMDAITPIIPIVKSLFDAFQGLPAPIKLVVFGLTGLVAAVGILAGPVMSIIGILEALGIIGPVAGAGAEAAGAGAEAGSAGFWSLSASLFGVEIPLWLIIAAIAAAVAAIYFIGQAFGLWNDPMEMCQVILDALSSALQYVAGILMGVFKAAWDMISSAISNVVSFIQMCQSGFNALGLILQYIVSIVTGLFMAAWNMIIQTFQRVMTFVQTLWTLLTAFASGQISISQLILTVWTALSGLFGGILNKLITKVVNFVGKFVSYAISMGSRFVSGVIGAITSLPGRVWAVFSQVIQKVQQAVSSAGQAAQRVAQAIWDGLTGKLGEVASWVQSNVIAPLNSIGSAISGVFSAAGSEDLPTTALEAGTYIQTASLGSTSPKTSTTKSVVNVGEINLKLDNVSDTQAKRIVIQALEGLEQIKEVRTV